MKVKDHSYSLTRGLGGMFVFASFEFLENDQFTWMLVVLLVGVLNMIPYLWRKKFSAIFLYGVDALLSAAIFYSFIQLDTRYIQWLWLLVFVYYVVRLRDMLRKEKSKIVANENNSQ